MITKSARHFLQYFVANLAFSRQKIFRTFSLVTPSSCIICRGPLHFQEGTYEGWNLTNTTCGGGKLGRFVRVWSYYSWFYVFHLHFIYVQNTINPLGPFLKIDMSHHTCSTISKGVWNHVWQWQKHSDQIYSRHWYQLDEVNVASSEHCFHQTKDHRLQSLHQIIIQKSEN